MNSAHKRVEIQKRAATLRRAAKLLAEDADAEQESCAVGDRQWTCADCKKDSDGKCQAMRNVEIRRKVAASLALMELGM